MPRDIRRDPLVTIIILNWNNPTDTIACLQSVMACNYPCTSILVVDNGSTDDSVTQIQVAFPGVHIIQTGANLGYAEGNNVGIMAALADGAEYILILNNDVQIAPDMLLRLMAALSSDPSIGMAGPAVFFADPPDRLFSAGSDIDWMHGQIHHRSRGTSGNAEITAIDVDFLVGCAVCARRDVVERIGGFDSAYYLNFEDVQWSVAAVRAGYRVVCVPQARVWHKVSSSIGLASPQNTYYTTRNALRFFWMNARDWRRLASIGCITLRMLRAIAAWTVKPEYRTDLYQRKRDANLFALRDFLAGRSGVMGKDVARRCYSRT